MARRFSGRFLVLVFRPLGFHAAAWGPRVEVFGPVDPPRDPAGRVRPPKSRSFNTACLDVLPHKRRNTSRNLKNVSGFWVCYPMRPSQEKEDLFWHFSVDPLVNGHPSPSHAIEKVPLGCQIKQLSND